MSRLLRFLGQVCIYTLGAAAILISAIGSAWDEMRKTGAKSEDR